MPSSVGAEDVKAIFSAYGVIKQCQRLPVTKIERQGQVIIVYDEPKGAVKAVQGRKYLNSMKARHWNPEIFKQFKLFVQNLPFNCTE